MRKGGAKREENLRIYGASRMDGHDPALCNTQSEMLLEGSDHI